MVAYGPVSVNGGPVFNGHGTLGKGNCQQSLSLGNMAAILGKGRGPLRLDLGLHLSFGFLEKGGVSHSPIIKEEISESV